MISLILKIVALMIHLAVTWYLGVAITESSSMLMSLSQHCHMNAIKIFNCSVLQTMQGIISVSDYYQSFVTCHIIDNILHLHLRFIQIHNQNYIFI